MPVAAAVWLLAGLIQGGPPVASSSDLRFHHIHLRVADPSTASREASARLNGSRTILQGHGLAVRSGAEYLVFEREEEILLTSGDSRVYGPLHAAAVYLEAARWAARLGITVVPDDFMGVGVRSAVPRNRIDRIAFSSPDPSAAIERLSRQGITPVEQTDEVARFRLSAGLTLEIIGETDRPDTHWCPMHPDIRAPGVTKCRRCGMDLVPIPPPRIGEYRLDVTIAPAADGRGAARLGLQVLDPETSEPVADFLNVHERRFHLFIIGRDLEYFAHVHPEQQNDGRFALEHGLAPGEYLLVADFLPAGGTPQMVQRAIITPDYSGPLFPPAPTLVPGPREQVADGLRVRLEAESLRALRPSRLRFILSDASTNAPVTDLEPYLGAAGHLLAVDGQLRGPIHGHPEEPVSSGPVVTFDPILPAAGRYKLWVQFQRNGRVITVPFVIEVPE